MKLLFISLFTLCSAIAVSQNSPYNQFTYINGLPTMTLYQLYCAPDGFNWLGSDIGLIRYDGREFKLLTTEDGLPDTEILRVFGDSDGRIWGMTFSNRIFYLKNNKVYNSGNSDLVRLLETKFQVNNFAIFPDAELFMFSTFKMVKVDGDLITEIIPPSGDECYLFSNIYKYKNRFHVFTNCKNKIGVELELIGTNLRSPELRTGPVWYDYPTFSGNYYLTSRGITNDQNDQLIIPETFDPEEFGASKIYVDREKTIWYFDNSKGIRKYENGKNKLFLPDFKVTDITQDFEGNYWIATVSNGLIMLPRDYEQKSIITSGSSVVFPVKSAFIDNLNRVWTGNTFDGISVYDIASDKIEFKIPDSSLYSRILDFDAVADNIIFAGSDNGIYELKISDGKIQRNNIQGFTRSCKSLVAIDKNRIYAAFSHGLIEFNRSSGVWSSNKIYANRTFAVNVDADSAVWFSAIDGIYKIVNGKNIQFRQSEMDGKRIVDFTFYNNLIIFSTDGYGLYAADKNSNKIVWRANITNGITSNLCRHLQIVGDTLYFNTINGLNRIKLSGNSMQVLQPYTENNGLPNNDIQDFYIRNNVLVVSGNFGSMVWRNFLSTLELSPPKFRINEIQTEKNKYIASDKIISAYQSGYIKIYYSVIRYAATAPDLEFSIDGNAWQGTQLPFVELSGLSPGNHVIQFRLKGFIIGEQPDQIVFFIDAPFYLQKWFLPVLISILALSIGWIIIYLNNKTKRKTIERLQLNERLAFSEQQALQSMMNPHFIFNAVNSVQQYIIKNDKKEANKYLTQFARLIRLNLETSKNKYITLEEEVERLSLYLQFEKVRFGEKLQYSISLPNDLETDKIFIPSMIIQPFVENAIWHGIIPKNLSGHININFESIENYLVVKIKDDGVGYHTPKQNHSKTSKESLGLNITKKRLQLLSEQTGKEHFFKIDSSATNPEIAEGTVITIKIPLRHSAIQSF